MLRVVDAVGQFELQRPRSEGRLAAVISDPASALPCGMRIAQLCAGLFLGLTLIAVTTPHLKGLRNPSFRVNHSRGSSQNLMPMASDSFGGSKVITRSLLAHFSFRRLDRQCRVAEPRFRRVRYSHAKRHRHCHEWSPRYHVELPYLFIPPQYWGEAGLTNGAADGIDLSGLGSADTSIRPIDGSSSVFGGSKIFFGGMADEVSSAGIAGWLTDEKSDSLALSGGSISGPSRVMVNADGTLQLSFAPNWSFIAKADGAFAPEPQIDAGSGTVQYTW
jgi:hypothetical protein